MTYKERNKNIRQMNNQNRRNKNKSKVGQKVFNIAQTAKANKKNVLE